MAAPVWILSVDLQTKTATFQTGMHDAARSARSAFNDIKSGSSDMAGHVGGNMFATRHAVMAVSEAFGVQMPRAITALITHIGPLGAALEAAFPFAAIALGAVLLIEAFEKMKAAGVKLTEDQVRFGTAVQTAFNTLDQRLLQAGIKSDELHQNHLGALHKQLELIDKQSMAELVHSFGEVAKAADIVFKDLPSHWYTFGIGADGAKHALDEFQTKYEALLAQGKDKDASDLLRGTRESAEKTLALQQRLGTFSATVTGSSEGKDAGKIAEMTAAHNELKKAGVGWTEKEVQAQQALVQALQGQEGVEERVAALKKLDSGNATTSTGNEMSAKRAEAARMGAELTRKLGELSLAAERDQSTASLAIQQPSIAARLEADVSFADREYRLALQSNGQLIDALDKSGKDYSNQLKGLQDKTVEMTAQHETTVAGLRAKASEVQSRKDLTDLEQGEREKIEATVRGSAERIAAIASAIKEEEALNLQGTAYFRELLTSRAEALREAAAEESKLQAEAGKQAAETTLKSGELILAAQREHQALMDSVRRVTAQQRMQEDIANANAEYALKLTALSQEIASLDKFGRDYNNKLKVIQDQQKLLVQEHENEITAIRDKAEMERNQKILAAEQRVEDSLAAGLTQTLMGHKSFASAMIGIANEVSTALIQAEIKHIEANLMSKQSDAAAAARKAFLAGESVPVIGPVLAPVYGAAAYAAVMAFQDGGVVPGVGRGDIVPALLEPGEGVVKRSAMDRLNSGEASATSIITTCIRASRCPRRRSIRRGWTASSISTATSCKPTSRRRFGG